MVLLSIFFTRIRSTEGSSADCSHYFVAPCAALHLAVKILQIFLYEDLSTLALHTSVGCISLQNASRTALCYKPHISENIPNIWYNHQQHKEADQIETMCDQIMQTTRPRITWKVLPMAQVAIFKEISDHMKRFRLWIVLFWTKTSQRLTLYLLFSYR